MPLMLLGEFCREERGEPLPQQRAHPKGGWGSGDAGVGETLTLGSPSMSPDPTKRKHELISASCLGAMPPTLSSQALT